MYKRYYKNDLLLQEAGLETSVFQSFNAFILEKPKKKALVHDLMTYNLCY